jgi:chitin disaccharide deacetylase
LERLLMDARRYLIVNADDFGQSHAINRGIIAAHEQGIVTSASLMVRWSAAAEAADYSSSRPDLSLGLHIDLGEWAWRDDAWVPVYEVVATDDPTPVRDEIERQLEAFVVLVGRNPTHVDSHQHVHQSEPVRSMVLDIAQRIGVPLRHCTSGVHYRGDFYGQDAKGWPRPDGITVEALVRLIQELPRGITELGCHPGVGHDPALVYNSERAQEVAVLCDPRVREAVSDAQIELVSFQDIATLGIWSRNKVA